jgi:hypothetical protein
MKWISRSRPLFSDSGSEIAEAALVLPLAFMLLLGIYWFGRAFNTYATINYAARAGARVAIAQTCASCSSPNIPPTVTTVSSAVTQALQASSVDPKQIILYPNPPATPPACPGAPGPPTCTTPPGGPNITFCNNVAITPATNPTPQVCGVTITYQYPYQFWLPFTSLNNQTIILTAAVQMAGEY